MEAGQTTECDSMSLYGVLPEQVPRNTPYAVMTLEDDLGMGLVRKHKVSVYRVSYPENKLAQQLTLARVHQLFFDLGIEYYEWREEWSETSNGIGSCEILLFNGEGFPTAVLLLIGPADVERGLENVVSNLCRS